MENRKRVTSLGGIFVKCNDPESLRNWYRDRLGFNTDQYGTSFEWRNSESPETKSYSVWSTFGKDTTYFQPSTKEFMINLRVDNLEWLLQQLKAEGVEQLGEMQTYEYGKFAHIIDPEGTKIELWEPLDEAYEAIAGGHITK